MITDGQRHVIEMLGVDIHKVSYLVAGISVSHFIAVPTEDDGGETVVCANGHGGFYRHGRLIGVHPCSYVAAEAAPRGTLQ
jgi:hypothetical protein